MAAHRAARPAVVPEPHDCMSYRLTDVLSSRAQTALTPRRAAATAVGMGLGTADAPLAN
jgi:hypothetical protein